MGFPVRQAQAAETEGTSVAPYEGVTPGTDRRNPLPPPKPGPPQLVWTGFQKVETGARVFLQTTRPVTPDITSGKTNKELVVFLRDCRIHLENNQRNLDTRFFDTPVAAVKAKQLRGDVQVTITLKQPVIPVTRIESGPEDSQFVVVDFPSDDRDQPAEIE